MESVAFSIALLVVFLLLVGIVLYLNRQARADLAETRLLLTQQFDRLSADATTMVEAFLESSRQQLTQTLQELARQQMANLQMTEASSKASASATSEMVRTQATLLNDALKMVGSRDPIAFQQLGGGLPLLPEQAGTVKPYTSADEFALREQIENDQRAEQLLAEAMGGLSGGSAFGQQPTYFPPAEPAAGYGSPLGQWAGISAT